VFDYVTEIDNKIKYDKNFDSGHKIREIDANHAIVYNKYKGKVLFEPRDFILITKKEFVIILFNFLLNVRMMIRTHWFSEQVFLVKNIQ